MCGWKGEGHGGVHRAPGHRPRWHATWGAGQGPWEAWQKRRSRLIVRRAMKEHIHGTACSLGLLTKGLSLEMPSRPSCQSSLLLCTHEGRKGCMSMGAPSASGATQSCVDSWTFARASPHPCTFTHNPCL